MNLDGLPIRATPDREYLGAIVDLIAEQNQMIVTLVGAVSDLATVVAAMRPELRPGPATPPEDRPVDELSPTVIDIEESDTTDVPEDAASDQVDPAVDEVAAVADAPQALPIPAPPASGPGSGRAAWAIYAASSGVEIHSTWNRDRIIQACRTAGMPI
jgi:hypothetical protein